MTYDARYPLAVHAFTKLEDKVKTKEYKGGSAVFWGEGRGSG